MDHHLSLLLCQTSEWVVVEVHSTPHYSFSLKTAHVKIVLDGRFLPKFSHGPSSKLGEWSWETTTLSSTIIVNFYSILGNFHILSTLRISGSTWTLPEGYPITSFASELLYQASKNNMMLIFLLLQPPRCPPDTTPSYFTVILKNWLSSCNQSLTLLHTLQVWCWLCWISLPRRGGVWESKVMMRWAEPTIDPIH